MKSVLCQSRCPEGYRRSKRRLIIAIGVVRKRHHPRCFPAKSVRFLSSTTTISKSALFNRRILRRYSHESRPLGCHLTRRVLVVAVVRICDQHGFLQPALISMLNALARRRTEICLTSGRLSNPQRPPYTVSAFQHIHDAPRGWYWGHTSCSSQTPPPSREISLGAFFQTWFRSVRQAP